MSQLFPESNLEVDSKINKVNLSKQNGEHCLRNFIKKRIKEEKKKYSHTH